MTEGIKWDVFEAQGMRPTMEDAYACDLELSQRYGFWAVFDGHGGPRASDFASKNLGPALREALLGDGKVASTDDSKNVEAISQCFTSVDDRLCKQLRGMRRCDGSTCISAVVLGSKLFVANTGDSRAVCGMNDGSVQAMSWDQTCDRDDVCARVIAAGGAVSGGHGGGVKRVNGELVPSRAMGDPEYKEGDAPHPVVAVPEVAVMDMSVASPKFAVLACDGLWDVCSNSTAVALVSRYLEKKWTATKISKALVEYALREGSTDNVTAMVIVFPGPSTRRQAQRAAAVPMPRR